MHEEPPTKDGWISPKCEAEFIEVWGKWAMPYGFVKIAPWKVIADFEHRGSRDEVRNAAKKLLRVAHVRTPKCIIYP